jgi:mRNA interferase MazF
VSAARPTIAPWQVWWANFSPQVGREQAGQRPTVVVGTALACALPNRLVLVVPCTSTDRDLPIHPRIVLDGRPGFAMCDQIKAISVDRLVSPHRARTLTDAEIAEITFVLRQLVSVD